MWLNREVPDSRIQISTIKMGFDDKWLWSQSNRLCYVTLEHYVPCWSEEICQVVTQGCVTSFVDLCWCVMGPATPPMPGSVYSLFRKCKKSWIFRLLCRVSTPYSCLNHIPSLAVVFIILYKNMHVHPWDFLNRHEISGDLTRLLY